MEKVDIAIGVGVAALLVSLGVGFQAVAGDSVDKGINESAVREIAGNLDDEQPSRYGEPIYTGTGLGYVVDFSNDQTFYHSGDTAPIWSMKSYIGERLDPEVAFLAAGGFYTSDMKTAAWEASLVDPETAYPHHYGTFPFMAQDQEKFEEELQSLREEGKTDAEAGKLKIGEWQNINGIRTFYAGHSTMLFQDPANDFTIAVDPWVMTNGNAPQSWKEDISNMPEVDMILLTHGHLDHFTPSTVRKIQEEYNATVLAEWELAAHMVNQGFSNVVAVNKGASLEKSQLLKAGATGGIEEMPEDMVIHPVWMKQSSSPATALGKSFGATVEGELTR